MSQAKTDPASMRSRAAGEVMICLHARADGLRMLVARTGREFSILEARPVTPGDRAAVTGAVSRHEVGRIIVVLPGSQAMCRVVAAPAVAPEQMGDSLTLLAEAELPETVPAHRRSAGLVPGAPGQAVLSAWLSGHDGAEIGGVAIPVQHVAAPAALAALLAGQGSALYADPADSSLSWAAFGDAPRIGSAVEDSTDSIAWREVVLGRGARLGCVEDSIGSEPVLLESGVLEERMRSFAGAKTESAWISQYAVATGGLLAAGAADPSVRSLAGLHAKAPKVQEPALVTVTRWLQRPSRQWALVAVGLAVALGGPYVAELIRLSILTSRTAEIDSSKEGREALRKRAALYAQLDNAKTGRLPMTKVLHDVSRVAPVGLTAPSIRISPEQGLSLQGTADKEDLVSTFQENLTKTRMFANVKVNRKEMTATGVEFDISADIVQPHLPVTGEDFTKETLAEKLYGPGALNTAVAMPKAPSRPTRTARGEDEGGEQNGSRRPTPSDPATPPAAQTDADIAKMDRAKAMLEFSARRNFLQKNPALDAATKQRLTDEVEKMRARLQQLSGGGQ
jgi:Tfp pilus assembly protein PilN